MRKFLGIDIQCPRMNFQLCAIIMKRTRVSQSPSPSSVLGTSKRDSEICTGMTSKCTIAHLDVMDILCEYCSDRPLVWNNVIFVWTIIELFVMLQL